MFISAGHNAVSLCVCMHFNQAGTNCSRHTQRLAILNTQTY